MNSTKRFNGINIKLEEPDFHDQLSQDLSRFNGDEDLGIIENTGMMQHFDTEDDDTEDVIILHMDIRESLNTLKLLLEQRVGFSLKNYQFWLQDAQILEPHKNLVDQCVQGEGLVQINVQVVTSSRRINIVDVLKPTDDVLANPPDSIEDTILDNNGENTIEEEDDIDKDKDNGNVIRWAIDNQFKRDQARLRIPDNPMDWTTAQVKHWLQWAVRQFNLSQIKLSDWSITGKELCSITLAEFKAKVPNDPGDIFWTHLELLRKCKFVAVIQKATNEDGVEETPAILRRNPKIINKQIKTQAQNVTFDTVNCGNRTGNNGQIQLWQFLLEILTDIEHKTIIQWIGGQGEFKLNDPEKVAQLWGERKNKPTMNYEKLSRALRYYYDGDMISKVQGKRFVYKFVCDLKQLIGYDAQELAKLVMSGRDKFNLS